MSEFLCGLSHENYWKFSRVFSHVAKVENSFGEFILGNGWVAPQSFLHITCLSELLVVHMYGIVRISMGGSWGDFLQFWLCPYSFGNGMQVENTAENSCRNELIQTNRIFNKDVWKWIWLGFLAFLPAPPNSAYVNVPISLDVPLNYCRSHDSPV